MISFVLQETNIVADVGFPGALQNLTSSYGFDVLNHTELAQEIVANKWTCASVIVQCKLLAEEFCDNPDYLYCENQILVSRLEQDAQQRTEFMRISEVEALLQNKEIPLECDNSGCHGIEQDEYLSSLYDAVFHAQTMVHYLDVIRQYKAEFEEILEDDYNDVPALSKEQEERAWQAYLLEQCLPRTYQKYERRYNMPAPFRYWDYRNNFQQWYFIKKPDGVYYISGGSGGSHQREQMGRWSHVFATLQKKYGIDIITYALEYGSDNVLRFNKEFPTFKVVPRELSGNYAVNDVKELFDESLFYYLDYE